MLQPNFSQLGCSPSESNEFHQEYRKDTEHAERQGVWLEVGVRSEGVEESKNTRIPPILLTNIPIPELRCPDPANG